VGENFEPLRLCEKNLRNLQDLRENLEPLNVTLLNHQTFGIFSILSILVGMLFSEAAMSIGMMALTANAVFNRNIANNFRTFVQNRALVGLTLVFFIVLISGLWSENVDWWVNRVRMKLPFLLLPFAVVALPFFDKKVYYPILAFFFWLMVGVCGYSLGLYLLNVEATHEAYKLGQVLFTPVMHVRFSLLVAYAIVVGVWLFLEKFQFRFSIERWLLLAATVFLLVYLHILAVRSGLVSFYAASVYIMILWMVKSKRYVLGMGVAGFLIIGSTLAIRFTPTLWNKIAYTRWSWSQFERRERLADLSDSYRLATIEAGLAIGNAHPVLGVGFGDIKDETRLYLQQHYPELLQQLYMPQSQYVLFYAATGFVGLLIFSFTTFLPLLYQKSWQHLLIGSFHIMLIVSFVVEQTLETQLGTAIYGMFAVLGIRHLMEDGRIGK
jgi:O-antigen ligase